MNNRSDTFPNFYANIQNPLFYEDSDPKQNYATNKRKKIFPFWDKKD